VRANGERVRARQRMDFRDFPEVPILTKVNMKRSSSCSCRMTQRLTGEEARSSPAGTDGL
jgi:hypothetical protein